MNEILLETATSALFHGDCHDVLPSMASASIDAVITDPPYPEVNRPYGRLTVKEWFDLMRAVVVQTRRVLRPHGSAVFILQPNSERVGRVRPWFFEFIAEVAKEWNLIQDVWWWNFTTPPTVHCQKRVGLLRPSVKAMVWLGSPDCYKDQAAVAWTESDRMAAIARSKRAVDRVIFPSGFSMDVSKFNSDGKSTPFNLLPMANTNSVTSGGAMGHGAATPSGVVQWWLRYITRPGDVVLDPFSGSGTIGAQALKIGRSIVAIEKMKAYAEMSKSLFLQTEKTNGKGISGTPEGERGHGDRRRFCQAASGARGGFPGAGFFHHAGPRRLQRACGESWLMEHLGC